jgi:PleD family two-component response regulator
MATYPLGAGTNGTERHKDRILVVDDDRNIRKITCTNLEIAGFIVDTAADGREAIARLEEVVPDLVVLDVMMPHMDGYEVAAWVRAHANPAIANLPIIMLTAKGETGDKVKAFQTGVDDYITKPFGPLELLARVTAKIRRVALDVSLSPLTRLPGNLAIESELRRRIAEGSPFAVLYMDLDNFKAFNDVYGFTHGDEAIRLTARIATEAVRRLGTAKDFVGHIGGDDFIVVADPDIAIPIAEDIIATFDREIRTLYSPAHLEAGYLETHDRRGTVRRFPIVSLSIAIVSTSRQPLTNYAQVGEVAAELKGYAKTQPGSLWVEDKRR